MKPELIVSLQFAHNFFEKAGREKMSRIAQYMAAPTLEKWNDIKGIVIREEDCVIITLCRAVMAAYPLFPADGIPSSELLEFAINKCVFKDMFYPN